MITPISAFEKSVNAQRRRNPSPAVILVARINGFALILSSNVLLNNAFYQQNALKAKHAVTQVVLPDKEVHLEL